MRNEVSVFSSWYPLNLGLTTNHNGISKVTIYHNEGVCQGWGPDEKAIGIVSLYACFVFNYPEGLAHEARRVAHMKGMSQPFERGQE